MVWGPEAMRLNLIWRWEFVITVAGRGGVGISGRAFIALHTLHLVGQFIALHAPQRSFILSPELWRRMAASVGPEAAPHLMELSRPNQTLGFSETQWWNFNKEPKFGLHLVFITKQNLLKSGSEPWAAAAAVWIHQEESRGKLQLCSHFSYHGWWGTMWSCLRYAWGLLCFLW